MLYKTKGIVINYVKFRESSIITKIYTESFGIQSYIENGVRSARGKNKIALFQPLTLLDLVVYHDTKKDINRISEIKCNHPFHTIPYDIKKSSIAIFINEILVKSLKEHEENKALFAFLENAILYFDNQNENFENFHLHFLLSYCGYLGFAPENAEEIIDQLMHKAINVKAEKESGRILNQILKSSFGEHIALNRTDRVRVLEIIMLFFKIHLEDFGEMKSMSVLKEVLD